MCPERTRWLLARPRRFELLTFAFGGQRSMGWTSCLGQRAAARALAGMSVATLPASTRPILSNAARTVSAT
jgi:hypothetical protein